MVQSLKKIICETRYNGSNENFVTGKVITMINAFLQNVCNLNKVRFIMIYPQKQPSCQIRAESLKNLDFVESWSLPQKENADVNKIRIMDKFFCASFKSLLLFFFFLHKRLYQVSVKKDVYFNN